MRIRSQLVIALVIMLVTSACTGQVTPVAAGETNGHPWSYELIDGELPRWVIGGRVMSETTRIAEFSRGSPHLYAQGGWFHMERPFVQVSVIADDSVDRIILVVDGRFHRELELQASTAGPPLQHAAAGLENLDSWSAVVACSGSEDVGFEYGWLPDGFPDWLPKNLCAETLER